MIIERPALYLVGTPIGNLDDFSPRAVEILSECDFVAAEDTRVAAKLMSVFDIHKPSVSYFEHNAAQRGPEIIEKLKSGQCCALVTDAGMPAISDPGEALVKLCAENDIPVHSVPGPSAVVTALAMSGLSTSRFTFEGFLSVNKKSRMEHLELIKDEYRTMVFYEAPHKLRKTLRDFAQTFGDERKISICRELTKLHEEVIRTTCAGAYDLYKNTEPRGEFVLVVEGKQTEKTPEISLEDVADAIRERYLSLIAEGMGKADAMKQTATEFGRTRNEIYPICMRKD